MPYYKYIMLLWKEKCKEAAGIKNGAFIRKLERAVALLTLGLSALENRKCYITVKIISQFYCVQYWITTDYFQENTPALLFYISIIILY